MRFYPVFSSSSQRANFVFEKTRKNLINGEHQHLAQKKTRRNGDVKWQHSVRACNNNAVVT